ncbi:hypothetical protein GPA22_02670 [Aromatoleum toluvorans]|uniref:Uncharacterized protein n=1 Tax=Aromatoleum toluvorans TaxID=92002 RepID=A0ABX1PVB1_9RHOO|nr:hypothetical protein [Aromatoleum toluvorans]
MDEAHDRGDIYLASLDPTAGCERHGTRRTGVVRCDHPRAFDLDSRRGRKLESVLSVVTGNDASGRDSGHER